MFRQVKADRGHRQLIERAQRKTRTGTVVSDKMDKTVVVMVETRVRHPLYGRTMTRSQKFKAHDEINACKMGDKVRIMETRPLSKEKRWRVIEVLVRTADKSIAKKGAGIDDTTANNA
jgi:small subunit ribosomal protein S17